MGLISRVTGLGKSKRDAFNRKHTNYGTVLEVAYMEQLQRLAGMKRSVEVVEASRARILESMRSRAVEAQTLAQRAASFMEQGNEDAARATLRQKVAVDRSYATMKTQLESIMDNEHKVREAYRKAEAQVEELRIQKDGAKATYDAARAEAEIAESFAGLDTSAASVVTALANAEDETARLQARSSSLESMIPQIGSGHDDIDASLADHTMDAAIEAQMKEIGRG